MNIAMSKSNAAHKGGNHFTIGVLTWLK